MVGMGRVESWLLRLGVKDGDAVNFLTFFHLSSAFVKTTGGPTVAKAIARQARWRGRSRTTFYLSPATLEITEAQREFFYCFFVTIQVV